MRLLLRGGRVYRRGEVFAADVAITEGVVAGIGEISPKGFDRVISFSNRLLIPGFVDVHVHLREPGFSYKETILTGTMAAARGGYTAVCAMPNLRPAPDDDAHLAVELAAIARDARVRVYPYGAITVGQAGRGALADFAAMPEAVAFSDDGRGVQDEGLMREAMLRAKALGKMIVAHCEDEALLPDASSEWRQLERDLRLLGETGCAYHACHLSTKESVELMREAKKAGLNASCETAPHYLLLSERDVRDEGRFRMNPPIRAEADRLALAEGLADGTVDMVATDHAPHSAEEKSRGFLGSVMGVVGLETAFPALYSGLVCAGALSLETLLARMCDAPRARFGLPGGLEVGAPADLAALDLDREYTIDPQTFCSLGRSTPFAGRRVRGENTWTMVGGREMHPCDAP